MRDLILNRLASASIEIFIVTLIAVLGIKIFKIKSARLCALIWLLVMIKPLLTVFAGAPVKVMNVREPDFISKEVSFFQRPDLVMARMDLHNLDRPAVDDTNKGKARAANSGELNYPKSLTGDKSQPIYTIWGNLKNRASSIKLTHGSIFLYIWFTGICFFGFLFLKGNRILSKIIKNSRPPISAVTLSLFKQLCNNLGIKSPPLLKVSGRIKSPALVRIFKPTILLPEWLDSEGNIEKLRWSLHHELIHYRMRDPLWLFLRQVATTFMFFHPCIWYAGKQWEEAMELACDRTMISNEDDAHSYAQSLYKILEYIKEEGSMKFANGLFATRTQIGKRIATLLGGVLKSPARISITNLCLFALIALFTLSLGLNIVRAANPVKENSVESTNDDEKTKKAKLDLRSLGVAMEAYQVDFDAYPLNQFVLTSPIAYLREIPRDPFSTPESPQLYKYFLDEKSGDWAIYSVGANKIDEKGKGDDITWTFKWNRLVPYSVMKEDRGKAEKLDQQFKNLTAILQVYALSTKKIPSSIDEIISYENFKPFEKTIKENISDPFSPANSLTIMRGKGETEVIISSVGSKPDAKIEISVNLKKDAMEGIEKFDSVSKENEKGLIPYGEDNALMAYEQGTKLFSKISVDTSTPQQTFVWLFDNQNSKILQRAVKEPWSDEFNILLLFFDIYKPSLEKIHQGRLLDKVIYPKISESSMPIPNFLCAQIGSKLLCARASYYCHIGKNDEAISDLFDAIALGWRMRNKDATLISNLVGIAVEKITLGTVRNVIKSGKLNKGQLNSIIEFLTKIDKSETDIGEMLTLGELQYKRSLLNTYFNSLEGKKENKEIVDSLNEEIKKLDSGWTNEKALQEKEKIIKDVERLFAESAYIGSQPLEKIEKEDLWDKFEKKREEIASKDPFIKVFHAPYKEAEIRYHNTRAERRIVCVMSAMELKKLSDGSYPKSKGSSDSVDYVLLGLDKSLCQDPFMIDSTLLFFSDGKTYNVWSVGPDLQNAELKTIYDPTNGTISEGDI